MRDIFYETMKKDIISFYDKNYCGSFGEAEAVKNLHLTIFNEEYDLKYFENGNLRKSKIEFLTNVQNLVNDKTLE